MTYWLAVYVVRGSCYVRTIDAAPMADAATVRDELADVLRAGGVRHESLTVTGPYARVVPNASPYRFGDERPFHRVP